MSSDTRECDILDLNGLIMRPPLLNTRSIGELDAGTLRARMAGKYNLSSIWLCSFQKEMQSNDGLYSHSIELYLFIWAAFHISTMQGACTVVTSTSTV